ncbi:PREDICTED: ketohexokinase-like isoform X2 [Dinoponera quadriceps]|uniref:Ketohexokinase-like isoform X2 n=1 Tax=Dinoponera quadriceps TaxID=609295 RepID=A0A6P3Y8D1_DINQU|nr:PREDICTED: ketohexokinase-like isoform X2 [Dinoponera quadriceps]
MESEKKILCVGIICLDIIQTCEQFPLEDSTGRSTDYRWQRGGNSSNSCTVLSLLGQPCELLACLCADEHGSFLQNDLRKYNIDYRHCPIMPLTFGCPVSTIILSSSTGSRTIIHHKASDFPELTYRDFDTLDLGEYSWIHFEGRNFDQVLTMIQRVKNYNNSLNTAHGRDAKYRAPITISVELERPRSELLDLLNHADVAFIAKDFAKSQGLESMSEILRNVGPNAKPGATIICTWAEQGAMARTGDGTVVQSPAFPPRKVTDTLGAGDTFNAVVLHYLNKSKAEFTTLYKRAQTNMLYANCPSVNGSVARMMFH